MMFSDLISRSPFPQGRPLDMLHDDESVTLVLFDVVDRTDIRMVQCRSGLGLLNEPRLLLFRC
ncbi:MAG: hypothetical protein WBH55_07845, partial [Bacteroidota bacterium]